MDTNNQHSHKPHITEDRRGWHLDKGVSITSLITLAITFITLIGWALTVEKRVDFNSYIINELSRVQREYVEREEIKHDRMKAEVEKLKDVVRGGAK